MYVIIVTSKKKQESWIFTTAFNVERKPEIVLYDSIEQAKLDIQVMEKVNILDNMELSFKIVPLKEIGDLKWN